MPERSKKYIKIALIILIVGAIVFFFAQEFKKNWDDILEKNFRINVYWLIASFVMVIAAYLANTLTWRQLINAYHKQLPPITVKESIAIVNTTQLAKYIPGKVWSYAVQIYWLSKRGYSKSKVLFINIVATLSTLCAATFIGVIIIAVFHAKINSNTSILLILGICLAYSVFVFFHTPILNLIIILSNKFMKKKISPLKISLSQIIKTQLFYIITNLLFGLSIFLTCMAIGLDDNYSLNTLIVGSFLIGDVVGFLFIIIPGGLGVRESMMFFIIAGSYQKDVALVVPLATRLLTMTADISMGILGFFLGKKNLFYKKAPVD